jgi:hypothetical protein
MTMPRVESKALSDEQSDTIDEIIASCDGDMRGAVKALLLVNEQLESDLRQLHADVCRDRARVLTKTSLH